MVIIFWTMMESNILACHPVQPLNSSLLVRLFVQSFVWKMWSLSYQTYVTITTVAPIYEALTGRSKGFRCTNVIVPIVL